jgi:hypothetical protein
MQNYVVHDCASLYRYRQAITTSKWHSASLWGESDVTQSILLELVRYVGTTFTSCAIDF